MSNEMEKPPHPWLEALERGRADVEAGRVSDLEPFLRELEAEDAAEMARLNERGIKASLGE